MEKKINGKIIGSNGGLYTVMAGDGEIVRCRARGVFRYEREKPLVGDDVTVTDCPSGGMVIDSIGERKNSLIRPPMANLDILFVTMASASPEPSLPTADKLISIAEFNRIEPVIVVGKSELDPEAVAHIREVYTLAGYEVFVLSCATGQGVDEISDYVSSKMKGKTAAFAGASGVGKSTLMNALFPGLSLGIGEVNAKTERGRHTTRAVELYSVRGGFVADTPGFSMLDFERFDFFSKEDLPHTFREFSDCLGNCRYTRCTHTREDGCAVLEKVSRGEIARTRHESYLALYSILKDKHDWNKK